MYKCDICDKLFETVTSYAGHKSHCGKNQSKECPICHKIITKKSGYESHVKSHKNKSKCKLCEKETCKDHIFCSKDCWKTFTKNNRRKEGKVDFCINCGKETNKGGYKYCSVNCQRDFEYKKRIELWKKGELSGIKGGECVSSFVRRYIKEKYNNKCSVCGWGEINPFTGKVPVEIEHIDGNPLNNKEENLTLICPNCHSLTKTYKGANKGSGRSIRRRRYENEKKGIYSTISVIKEKKIYFCSGCGKEIWKNRTGLCIECYTRPRKVDRPPYEQLIKEIEETNYCEVGRKYGVSNKSIKKWVDQYEKELM